MLHVDRCQNFLKNHLYSNHHVRRSHDTLDPEVDFDFWGAHKHICCENFDSHALGGSDLEVQILQNEEHADQYFGCYSPTLRETNILRLSINDESSPLLPNNHQCSNLSPTSRRQAILESRRELLEMMHDMPESCYELSLKDIVDERQGVEGVKEEIGAAKTETQIRKPKSNTKKRYSQISRTSSMQSQNFRIKMFFPTFLCSKKAKSAGNSSKVSLSPSLRETENRKTSCRSCSNGSTSSSNSSTRFSDGNILRGCFLFRGNKNESKRQWGCLL